MGTNAMIDLVTPIDDHPLDSNNLSDQVYTRIRQKIFLRDLAPGSRVDINRLASTLRVSRTPVVNALIRLTEDGLVRTIPRRGVFITELTDRDVIEHYDIRQALEFLAVDKGMYLVKDEDLAQIRAMLDKLTTYNSNSGEGYFKYLQANQAFHLSFIELAGNRMLITLYSSLHTDAINARLFYHGRVRQVSEVYPEHLAIFQAYESRDPEAAKAAIRAHNENAKIASIRSIQDVGGVV